MKRALIVFISGCVIELVSFLFALLNMGFGALSAFNGNFQNIATMFVGHLGAMAGFAIGGFVCMVGFGLFIYEIVKLIKK